MSKWYRNREGYPKVSLREILGKDNAHLYQREVKELISITDVKRFYNSCKIITPSNGLVTLVNNAFSDEILESFTNNKFTITIKPRQIGYSTTSGVIALYQTQFLNKSVVIVNRKYILDRVKELYVNLPEHLKYGVKKLTKKCIFFNNDTYIKVSSKYPKGTSPELVIFDEYDFLSSKQIKDFIISIAPSVAARIGDQVLIGSTINHRQTGLGSIRDMISNKDYGIYNFSIINLNQIDLIMKQFERNKKINEILDENT